MKYRMETEVVHGVEQSDPHTGALSMPIYQTSTFVFKNSEQGARRFKGEESGYIYSRLGNPNTDVLGKKIALLEGYEAGMTTGSGMAAVANVVLAAAGAGDHIIVDDTVYGGTHYLIEEEIRNIGIEVTRVDASVLGQVENAMQENTRLIMIETPANPTLKLIDITGVVKIAHQGKALVCVDNTFLTPFYQRPKEFGADIVLHSATKYISGHGDVVAGIIVGDQKFINHAFKISTHYGWTLAPFNAWLLLRGLKTMGLRVHKSQENAQQIASWLEDHKAVEKVYYPFLKSHSQYDLARKQQSGGGGIIAFELKGGYEAGKTLMDHVHLCTLAVSLGDCDTLIQHPASMTHAGMSEEAMREAHITPGLVRLAVGVEHVQDLIEDLDKVLQKL
ncbi:MAG: aminotransferase class I/II-fold pyridoxal phosphate-dependent enzyme [Calditrichaeota bacterium]|nr:aminotransferase class I/II-fold pyridoxal phosphate-dependent enzyme [Calditrichota bacterium]RQW01366.1 MAG: aminotransferase class I/II-fold pyridoxal phosphate-dependent enzyme [Calditrichota bacterium]